MRFVLVMRGRAQYFFSILVFSPAARERLCLCIDLLDHNAIDNGTTDHHGAPDDHSRHLHHIPLVHVIGWRSEHLHRDFRRTGHNELRKVQELKKCACLTRPWIRTICPIMLSFIILIRTFFASASYIAPDQSAGSGSDN